jgi:acetylornithine deacetylase/succinyl-diaminopimelate desuccinylase-like protein
LSRLKRNGGETFINAIPAEAWMEVDMRPADVASLKALDEKFHAAVRAAVDEENRRWNNRRKVRASPELLGLRPAGQTPEGSSICANCSRSFARARHAGESARMFHRR